MAEDDRPRGHALRPRGADVVGAQVVEHRGAGLLGEHREAAVDEARDRQREMPQQIEQVARREDAVLPARQVEVGRRVAVVQAAHREEPEVLLVREVPDREDARPHRRHRPQRDEEGAARDVEEPAAPHRREHAGRDRDQVDDRNRDQVQEHRHRQRRRDEVDDRTSAAERNAEVRRSEAQDARDHRQPDLVVGLRIERPLEPRAQGDRGLVGLERLQGRGLHRLPARRGGVRRVAAERPLDGLAVGIDRAGDAGLLGVADHRILERPRRGDVGGPRRGVGASRRAVLGDDLVRIEQRRRRRQRRKASLRRLVERHPLEPRGAEEHGLHVLRRAHDLARGRDLVAGAELDRADAAEPADVLHEHRVVETVAVLEVRLELRGLARLHLPAAHAKARPDAARREGDQHEDEQRDPDEGRDHQRESSGDVRGHESVVAESEAE